MNTFINDKIASFTHDALLIFQQHTHLTSLSFAVNDVLLENMPKDSRMGILNNRWVHHSFPLPGKSIFIHFNSVPTI